MAISAETAAMPPPPDPELAAARRRRGAQSKLHRFSFPILKKWGSQKVLRCLNVNRNGEIIGGGRRPDSAGPRIQAPGEQAEEGGGGRRLEEVRAKLLAHLRHAADRLKLVVPPMDGEPQVPPEPKAETAPVPAREPSPSAADAVVPWALRATRRRRGSSRAPIGIERTVSISPPADRSNPARTLRLRSEDAGRRERPRFSVTLSRDEIDEDIYSLTGCLPRRRPRRTRARILQNQLDSLFPGSWLTEITADSYKELQGFYSWHWRPSPQNRSYITVVRSILLCRNERGRRYNLE